MSLQDHIDVTTLTWIKPELEQTLEAARQALEGYVDNPDNPDKRDKRDLIRVCAGELHQVHGTLRMVDLHGAAMVAEEMETLAIALLENHLEQRGEACAALMRGLMQLPDYLERLSSGYRDVPMVLLPLLNDLRASRGQPALHDAAMFIPNLDAALPAIVPGAASADEADARHGELADLRRRFQQQLLAWFRTPSVARQSVDMQQTLLAICARCYSLAGRRLWWIAAAVLEGVDHGLLQNEVGEVRQLIGRVDRCLRQLVEAGEDSLHVSDADELARKLLYFAAQTRQSSPQMDLLRQTYGLDALVPSAGELAHARGSMAGHNRALLDSVTRALKDDLLHVKEALDLFLCDRQGDPARLAEHIHALERIGDTLGMLELGVPERVVDEQRRVLADIVNRQRAPNEETLLDMAGALLYVEASLNDHIDTLGVQSTDAAINALPRSEARNILAALMHEAINNTGKVKDSIIAFVESGWQHAELAPVTTLMDEVAGALRMLCAPRSASLAESIGRFIGNELVQDRRVPASVQMDQLADALAALEYYLEALRERRGVLEHILDIAEHSLDALGYWPPPPVRAAADAGQNDQSREHLLTEWPAEHALLTETPPVEPDRSEFNQTQLNQTELNQVESSRIESAQQEPRPVESSDRAVTRFDAQVLHASHEMTVATPPAPTSDDELENDSLEHDGIELEEGIIEQVPARDALTAEEGFRFAAAGIDDDIRKIFIEEVQEEIDSLHGNLKRWLVDNTQTAALIPIRRSLHTLKGSGRLVGAHLLSELAWKVENMLNRVLDESIQPTEQVQSLLSQAIDALPQLLSALKNEGHLNAPIAAIMHVAEQLAAGQPASIDEHAPFAMDSVLHRAPRAALWETNHTQSPAEHVAAAQTLIDSSTVEPTRAAPIGPVIPPVDPVLLEIMRSEVAHYLLSMRMAVQRAKSGAGGSAAAGELVVDDELMRAVHTLHGAIAMVEIPLLPQLLSPLESLLKRLHATHRPLSTEGVRRLGQAADVIDHVMRQFDTAEPRLPEFHALIEGLTELRDAQPELKKAPAPFGTLGKAISKAEAKPVSDAASAATNASFEALFGDLLDEPTAAVGGIGHGAHAPPDEPATDEDAAGAVETSKSSTESGGEFAGERESEPEPAWPADGSNRDEQTSAAMPATVNDAFAPASLSPTDMDNRPAGDVDADLLEIFIEEAREIIDHTEVALTAWRREPADASHIGSLLRDLHTLKGGARIAGLTPVGDLAHAMEAMLEKPLEADPARTSQLITTLEAGFDQLLNLLRQVTHGDIDDPRALIDRCLALCGQSAAGETPWAAGELSAPAVDKPYGQPPLPPLLLEQADETRAPQELIRVRAELLDNLVNHAGEVAIYRSRLEQQVAGYRFNLIELEQTVARLRSQLRMLEIETEAQIIARFQREHREAGMGVFDPLELDRYSQLQQYSRALAESVSDLVSIQHTFDELTQQSETLLIQQSRVDSALQDGLLRTRMLPFDVMVPNLRRTLRQAAREQGKQAQLVVEGAHGEMDRNLLDRIKAPFEHMLRNAIAHGIEAPDARRRAGKPAQGTVRIRVVREATEVVVRVADDGRGLDRAAIHARAIEHQLIAPDARLSDEQLLRLIAQPGFSTADELTQLAGRGVGLDVVANQIEQLGGTLAVESQPGQGTCFEMRLPFTFAVTQAMLVRSGEVTYAIPMTSVQGVARIASTEFAMRLAEPGSSFQHHGETYGIHDLAELLGGAPMHADDEAPLPLLLTHSGELRAAIRIDAVLGSREIVVKSVGPQISSVPGILGATILGDGSVLIILDLAPLVRYGIARHEQRLAKSQVEPPLPNAPRARTLVLVVDDSITMRKVTGRVLERHEYEVSTAKDGIDALEKLAERLPDLMLLDIEMPRMDGYELAARMKADPRLRHIPIIMITSRSGEKHRQRAFELGVERYLGKPYQEADLLTQIAELLEQRTMETGHE